MDVFQVLLAVKPSIEPLPKILVEVLHGVKQKVTGGWVTGFLRLAASTSVFRRTSGIATVEKEKKLIGSAVLRVTRCVSSIIV